MTTAVIELGKATLELGFVAAANLFIAVNENRGHERARTMFDRVMKQDLELLMRP